MPGGFLKKKTIKMSPELARMIQEQLAAFKERFGREAGPEDPVFFDSDADTPQPISEEKLRRIVVHAAEQAGLDPELVLAALGFNESR